MKIKVKTIKVLKAGTNDYGDWKLVKVYTDDMEYTTLAEDANLIPSGATINITDMDEDERGKKFKKFEIIDGAIEGASKEGEAKPQRGERNSSTNASIESQVGQKGGIEVLKVLIEQALLTDGEIKECKKYAMKAVDWAMARIDLPSVIIDKIEEVKGETIETDKDNQEAQGELTDRQDSGGTTDEAPNTIGIFLTWLKQNGIKAPRTFLEVEYKVSDKEVLTLRKCQELYNQIKKDKKF